MSSPSRGDSRDRADSRLVRHQHSFSESGRSSVPMWDSSDPDRAPPPLPLNPGTAINSPVTKPNVSSTIEKAAALIASRAIENAPSAYTSNPPPSSPDKNLMKPHHRRMQSIQTGSVNRLSDSLERRSPDKGLSRTRRGDIDEYRSSRSYDRSPTRSGLNTPTPGGRTTPSTKSHSDENTTPSSNMLALQSIRNRQDVENPFADITNGPSMLKPSMSLDSLSNQILNITSIATSLQQEMTNLSRRSKDNASDLVSLKEATNLRDEDIRKSLKDLRVSIDTKFTAIDARRLGVADASKSTPNLSFFMDDKIHDTPTRKTFTLPRIASPSLLDHDITASPSVVSVDGAASIALLEKVLREMATREGLDKLMNTLETAKAHTAGKTSRALSNDSQPAVDPQMMLKIEEILGMMKNLKENSNSKALVKAHPQERGQSPSQIDFFLDGEGAPGSVGKGQRGVDRRASDINSATADFISEEVMKILKSVKQSLSQNGGLTNEVKTLVRELRGEVLGMGRELAKKLEVSEPNNSALELNRSPKDEVDIALIVQQGLAEMKEHMHHIVQENHQQLTKFEAPPVSTREVVSAVTTAMAELSQPNPTVARDLVAERADLLAAVKEAWEDCKPEIALEHFGLERDEILETLKEGLQSYKPQQHINDKSAVSYEEVLEAVRKGLLDFQPPQIQVDTGATKYEIIEAIKDCLENYQFPPASMLPSQVGSDLTRDDVFDAVKEVLSLQVSHPRAAELTKQDVTDILKEGLVAHGNTVKEIEFNRNDLFDAIRACLEGEQNPLGRMGERVVDAMHEFLDSMKTEFKQYSAANGRDTEQVLDAMKDGLEDLRAEIESYVDRAADVTGRDEIIDTMKAGFVAMQADMEKGFSSRMQQALNTPELLDAMEKEFEHLRDSISKTLTRGTMTNDKDEILDAIRDINDDSRSSLTTSSADIAQQVKEELEHMRKTLAETMIRNGATIDRDEVLDVIREGFQTNQSMPRAGETESTLSNTSELLDAFQEGVDGIRSDMQRLLDRNVDLTTSYEILDTLKAGIEEVRSDINRLSEKQGDLSDGDAARGQEIMLHAGPSIHSEIESLKVMISQLRVKVESLDHTPVQEPTLPSEMRVHRDDLDEIHAAIRDVHDSVSNATPQNHKDDFIDVHATLREIHETVRNAETKKPDYVLPSSAASKEDVVAIETLLRNVKAQLDGLAMPDSDDNVKLSHVISIEGMLRDIQSSVEASSKNTTQSSSSDDFTVVGLLLKDVQAALEDLPSKINKSPEDSNVLTKTDLEVLETIALDTKEKLEGFSLPDIEYLATKEDVDEMKDSIKAFREQLEADNDLSAQAFEARKIEHGGLASKIDDVKGLISDVREELVGKLNGSEEGLVELAKVLGMHHDDMTTYATATSISELAELVTKGFDSYVDHHAVGKTEMEERDATMFAKHEEVTAELRTKIEDKFSELMLKYDDAQISNESKLNALEGRDKAHLEATTSVKTVVDDMRSLVDTLGTTVSGACERMSDDAKTVFEKVDDTNARIRELNSVNAQEHGLTREEVAKGVAASERVEYSLAQHQPAILSAIQEVLGIVGQHFEHSQQQEETLRTATEEIKSNVSAIPSAIPALLPALEAPRDVPSVIEVPAAREYDDSELRAKLDELLDHATEAKLAVDNLDRNHKATQESLIGLENLDKLEKLERLDGIHDQVRSAAEEISALLTTHTRLITSHHESKAEEAREAAIALEKRTAQKERVEAEIIALTHEKNALAESMAAMRREHEELGRQTKSLTREVAKLETALNLRQEEMRDMNVRAESLERRVLEGVINHARSLKLAKPLPKKKISPSERDASMSLKRVTSTSSNATAKASSVGTGTSKLGSAVGMALKKSRAPLTNNKAAKSTKSANADRRILSTSHVTGNRGSDAARALVLAPTPKTSISSIKRSHSVKSNPGVYVSSHQRGWNENNSFVSDKENHTIHQDEPGFEDGEEIPDDLSHDGTERRSSIAETYTDSMLYGTGSAVSRNSMRSTSYASSLAGTLNGHGQSIEEEVDEDEDEDAKVGRGVEEHRDDDFDEEEEQEHSENESSLSHNPKDSSLMLAQLHRSGSGEGFEALDVVGDLPDHDEVHRYDSKYAAPSDSGIGTEPLTPDVSNHGSLAWKSTVST